MYLIEGRNSYTVNLCEHLVRVFKVWTQVNDDGIAFEESRIVLSESYHVYSLRTVMETVLLCKARKDASHSVAVDGRQQT